MEIIRANRLDVVAKDCSYDELTISEGRIKAIKRLGKESPAEPYLLPGLVDAHVHIESSMLVPDEFAAAALRHGVVASVSDPHEIANVLGMSGIGYMHDRAKLTPFSICFGAPSCVPATSFETSGATLTANDIRNMLESGDSHYLSEVMNFPGVLNEQSDVMAKIAVAQEQGVPIDGHAPGLLGEQARRYAAAGVTTDHECTTLQEAVDKIRAGMSILIREGSAAKDFDVLHPLISSLPDRVMLCSDDKHPDDLLKGHIDDLVRRALKHGHNVYDVLRSATLNPVRHYNLDLGLLQPGDRFDAVLVDQPDSFNIQKVWLKGELVSQNNECLLPHQSVNSLNHFEAKALLPEDLRLVHPHSRCRVIVALDGQLWTKQITATMPEQDGCIQSNPDDDILFLAVVNRYQCAPPAVALVKGFGIKGASGQGGAIASSVAHDSHNVVAVGSSPEWLAKAINQVISMKGGLAAVDTLSLETLPLPVAGLMSDQPVQVVGPAYEQLNRKAHEMGSQLRSPFMTLSFMSLLVIPELKLSDKGLFDGNRFEFCELGEPVTDQTHD